MPVALPPDRCRTFVRDTVRQDALKQAYEKLRGAYDPSSIVEDAPTRIAIFEPVYDIRSKKHSGRGAGWTITYDLAPDTEGGTRVGVTIEYDRRTALMGGGLMKSQAQNEILHRLGALLAYERGWLEAQQPPDTDDPLPASD